MKKTILSLLLFSTLLVNGAGVNKMPRKKMVNKPAELTIIHINDHHSHLEPDEQRISLNGVQTKVNLGGYSAVNHKIKELRSEAKNPLVLHAGDAITGTLFFTLFNGSADAEVMNESKFHYFTLGNHEFDAGNEGLLKLLEPLEIEVLSANVIPDKNSILYNKWKPYDIVTVDGEPIGIIGLDTVAKTVNSSSPGADVKFYDEVTVAQIVANDLKSQGINKIILLSHAGTEKNFEIARKVNDIDIIITGDSHYLYGNDELRGLKMPVVHEYPMEFKNPNGEPVFVVEAWAYSFVVGELGVKFDKDGIASITKKTPHVLIHLDKLQQKNEKGKWAELEGEAREKAIETIKGIKSLSIAQEDPETSKILEKYKKEKDILAKQIIGNISGAVMPGGSANRIPNKEGSNPEGSIATRFVAETMLAQIGNVDLTIQNSGGVRADIVPGDVTYNDAYTFLPFGNTLYTFKMKGSEVKQVLEDALNYALTGTSTGSFPYGAGIRYEANEVPDQNGKRLVKVEVFNKETKTWEMIKEDKKYIVGVNNYIASGKDGYTTLGKFYKDPAYEGTDTFLVDAESFIDFMRKNPGFKAYTTSNVKLNVKDKALPKK